ncbi:hypothetical protein KUTeg_016034 [Tegillarca granosa]|uniref:DED domain-containing protein n=1 Tax=Tegillarca granosa TaxID=220873 RepID=A0ABQ9EKU9_TEGGR|nr:hypothetical protein KUTeg_016034 [Tegillarca granosa]
MKKMTSTNLKSWQFEFRSVLNAISQQLTEENFEDLRFILGDYLAKGVLDKAKDAKDVFTLMQESKLLSYDNTDKLIDILEKVNRSDQANELREFQKSLHLLKSVPFNLKPEWLVSHFQKIQKLAEIDHTISREDVHVVTLSGPLGAGKSQSAIWYGIEARRKNAESIVWHCNGKDKSVLLSSLRSLAEELSIHSLKSTLSEIEDVDRTITVLSRELCTELSTRKLESHYHLIIIDDVTKECTQIIQSMVRCFLSSEDLNTKFIVTTRNKLLLKGHGPVELNGFTPEESLKFLMRNIKNESQRDQYSRLAETMSNLPLGLYTARTYMHNMLIGPASFLRLLKQENIESIDEQLKEMDLESEEITLFTAMKFFIYTDLKDNIKPGVFEMFQMLQFLEKDDIPIILLEYVYREEGQFDTMLLSNYLVQAVQSRSLGIIGGEDDNRLLNIHGVVASTLHMCTPFLEKKRLMKKLIWGFALLMDKDVYQKEDRRRLELLIPQARSALKHVEALKMSSDFEIQVLLSYVYDLVGYGYNFGRFITISNDYFDKARSTCFQLLSAVESVIDTGVDSEIEEQNKETLTYYEKFAKMKADIVWNNLEACVASNSKSLENLVPRFIMQKFRVHHEDIKETLEPYLEPSSSGYFITPENYQKLVNRNLAVSLDIMNKYFLHELFVSIFYTYGRQIFYLGNNYDVKDARRLLRYLFLSKEIGLKLKEQESNLAPLSCLLSLITGTLQACLEDSSKLIQNKVEFLQDLANEYSSLFSLDQHYHMFGIFKMISSKNNIFKTNCLKMTLRCFTNILGMVKDDNVRKDIYEKGSRIAEDILQGAQKMGDTWNVPGYSVAVGQFYISFKNVSIENVKRAESLFESAFPKELLERNDTIRSLPRHVLYAGYGLVTCYSLTNKTEAAEKLRQKLQDFETCD